ncbi:NAD(P)H-dependent flavin oxidoreductase [Bacillus dakarensis]|uniref:NAD(P)H-dependent flavin oxidoreductase n=1 Tax=Robertmurraya dakarensis TaxID=1926278 RepID=UPI000980F632|nr:nitronate monooxygenase [Bacillus dakarensis]
MKTRITELLNIEYPILCGGMFRVGRAPLVAAVAEAGGIGFITSAHYETPEDLREDIRLAKRLTKKPIGVNLIVSPRKKLPNDEFIEVLLDEGIRIVETAGDNPGKYMKVLKDNDVTVIHKVPAVRYAKTAERLGADAVIIIGTEAGGHPGMDVGGLVLIPQTVDSVNIPVIAGGGIADGRGMAAALSLGAEGVLMASRFMATQESLLHENVKQWMVGASELDTFLIQRTIGSTTRVAKNEVSQKVLELESRGATVEELLPLIKGERAIEVFTNGNLDAGVWSCGSSVGLIHDVPTVKEVIEQIIDDAKSTLSRMNIIMG